MGKVLTRCATWTEFQVAICGRTDPNGRKREQPKVR